MKSLTLTTALCLSLSYSVATPVFAQDDDEGGFLSNKIEESLSGDGRTVKIVGFKGALSSTATMEKLTVADSDGIWLILEGAAMTWRRAALLRGNVVVEEMTADRVEVVRKPIAAPSEAPTAEASEFALPNLPVTIDIGNVSVPEVILGEEILGMPLEISLDASAQLADGSGNAKFAASRTDGAQGSFAFDGGFSAETQALDVELDFQEAANGIVAQLMKVPDSPALEASVQGHGPLADFVANFFLASDGEKRIEGTVELRQEPYSNGPTAAAQVEEGDDAAEKTETAQLFKLDMGGDITALFAQEYRSFFGPDLSLQLDGQRAPDGALDIDAFSIQAETIDLEGRARLSAQMWPTVLDVRGNIKSNDGTPVILPLSGPQTRIKSINLVVSHDAHKGSGWYANFGVEGLEQEEISLDAASLSVSGKLEASLEALKGISAEVKFKTDGLTFTDDALSQAIGDAHTGRAHVEYKPDTPIAVHDVSVQGKGLSFRGDFDIGGFAEGLPTTLKAALTASDISQFAAIAQRPVSGAANVSVSGSAKPLSGMFDLKIQGETNDLNVGVEQADPLISGVGNIFLDVARDLEGTTVREFKITTPEVTAVAHAKAGSGSVAFDYDAKLRDLGVILPEYPGSVTSKGEAIQTPDGILVDATLDAPLDSHAKISGLVTGPDMNVSFDANLPDLGAILPDYPGPVTAKGVAKQSPDGIVVDAAVNAPLGARAEVAGLVTGPSMNVTFDALLPDLGAILPEYPGPIAAKGEAKQSPEGIVVDAAVNAPLGIHAEVAGIVTGPDMNVTFDALLPDLGAVLPEFPGPVTAKGVAKQSPEGIVVDAAVNAPLGARAEVAGLVTGPSMNVTFDALLPDLGAILPEYPGPIAAKGEAKQSPEGIVVDAAVNAPMGVHAEVAGLVTGPDMNVTFDALLPDLGAVLPEFPGPVTAKGVAKQSPEGIVVDAAVDAPLDVHAEVSGLVTGPDMNVSFDAQLADLGAILPQFPGAVTAKGVAKQSPEGIVVDAAVDAPLDSGATASGLVTGPNANISFDAKLGQFGAIVSALPGSVELVGGLKKQGADWQVETSLEGSMGISAQVGGLVLENKELDLAVTGQAPLGLAGPFIVPHTIDGTAQFDLSVNGAPSLNAVSGQVTIANSNVTVPEINATLQGIGAQISLQDAYATLDASAQLSSGGSFAINGGMSLVPGYDADIGLALQSVVLEDPTLYKSLINGDIKVSGPLTGGALIAGVLNIGETTVSIPTGAVATATPIPEMEHISPSSAVRTTLDRAGLSPSPEPEQSAGGGDGPEYALDLTISAPRQIFIRGRGLDAEMGGGVTLAGTTKNIVSTGSLELLRGRIRVLEKRFDLTDGRILLEGSLDPRLDLRATTPVPDGEASIVIGGFVSEPEITFESDPPVAEDQVLALIFFGERLEDLSTFQTLQLASAVATLAGKGGTGLISKLRSTLPVDDFELDADEDGNATVRVGKHLTDSIYSGLEVNSEGDTEISLNMDLTTKFTATGTSSSDGSSSIGVFFNTDY